MHVVLLTQEHQNRLQPLSGGALRVAGLKFLLKLAGHEVTVLRPTGVPLSEGEEEFEFLHRGKDGRIETNIASKVQSLNPGVLIAEQWGILDQLELPSDLPVICDLHGSLIRENQARGYRDPYQVRSKVLALSRCDALMTPSVRQQYYYSAWAQMAGMDPQQHPVHRVGLALPESWYDRQRHRYPRLAVGGALWPWVDQGLRADLEKAIEDQGFFLQRSVYQPHSSSLSPEQASEDATGGLSHADWVQELLQCQGAWDYYELNPERELAVTTRTMEYLYCGLPPVYPEGMELSGELSRREIGIVTNDPLFLMQSPGFSERLRRTRDRLLANSFLKDVKDQALAQLTTLIETVRPRANRLGPIGKLEMEKRNLVKANTELSDENEHLKRENLRHFEDARMQKDEKQTLYELRQMEIHRMRSKTQG